ncbi:MAG: hypothetical protein ACLBM1_04980 [Cuspidothrix sp.]
MFVSVLTLWDKPKQTAAHTVVSQNTQVKELAVANNIAQLTLPLLISRQMSDRLFARLEYVFP